jgi:hypothetical protein
VSIDETAAQQQTPFNFIDSIKLTGLEPGVIVQRPAGFGRSSTFLVGTPQIDCLAHLDTAPVNTRLTGRVYNVVTGTLITETTAYAQKQGRQAVQLSWENTGWQPGHYRIVVSVEQGSELNTDVALVAKIRAEKIILCHQVDKNSGPVGADWPFHPGT